MKQRISVKPLSINDAYTGKRFATDKYEAFRKEFGYKLKAMALPEPPFEIYFKFGQSNEACDWDGPIKAAQDVLANKFHFNDKLIRRGIVEMEIVAKGKEYIEFELKHFENRIYDSTVE